MGAGPDRDAQPALGPGGGLRGAAAHDLQAPGAAALEQLVRVDLVPPAEEMRFGIIVRRAENREALLGFSGGRTALQLLQPALGLFGGRPLHVSPRHASTLHGFDFRSQGMQPPRSANPDAAAASPETWEAKSSPRRAAPRGRGARCTS